MVDGNWRWGAQCDIISDMMEMIIRQRQHKAHNIIYAMKCDHRQRRMFRLRCSSSSCGNVGFTKIGHFSLGYCLRQHHNALHNYKYASSIQFRHWPGNSKDGPAVPSNLWWFTVIYSTFWYSIWEIYMNILCVQARSCLCVCLFSYAMWIGCGSGQWAQLYVCLSRRIEQQPQVAIHFCFYISLGFLYWQFNGISALPRLSISWFINRSEHTLTHTHTHTRTHNQLRWANSREIKPKMNRIKIKRNGREG